MTREQGRYSINERGEEVDIPFGDPGANGAGSVMLGVRKTALAVFMETCGSFLLVVLSLGAVAGAFASGANVVLAGLLGFGVQAAVRYASAAGRSTPHLPRHLDPGFTWFEWCRGTMGAVIVVFYWIGQVGGALLGALLLCNLGLFHRDYFAGPNKFGASVELSLFAYWAFYTAGLTIVYWIYGQCQTFTSNRYAYSQAQNHAVKLQSIGLFTVGQFGMQLGILSFNSLITIAGIVAGGTATAVTGSVFDSLNPGLFAPIAAGIFGAIFVKITWNVNIFSPAMMRDGYARDILQEAGGNGGAAHDPVSRHEVNPTEDPSKVNGQVFSPSNLMQFVVNQHHQKAL